MQCDFLKKYKIELAYTILLIFILINVCPSYLDLQDFWRSYIANYYVLSYKNAGGFVARGLLGSITEFFFESINSKVFYFTFLSIYFFVYIFIGFAIIRKFKDSISDTNLFVLVSIIMFNPATLNYPLDFARPDLFLVIIALLIFMMIHHNVLIIAIPFLCVIGIFIHEGFIVLFVPTIATYLLYNIISKKRKKHIITFILMIICCLASFLIVFKYGKSDLENCEDIQANMQENIDIPLNPNMLSFEHGPMKQDLKEISVNELSQYKTIIALFFYTLIFIPLIIWYFRIFKRYKSDIENKLILFMYKIAPFSGLIMIFAGVDYGRWYSMSITCLLIQAYFYAIDEHQSVEHTNIIHNQDTHLLFPLALLALYLIIGPMGDIHEHFGFLEKLNNLYNLIFYSDTVNF